MAMCLCIIPRILSALVLATLFVVVSVFLVTQVFNYTVKAGELCTRRCTELRQNVKKGFGRGTWAFVPGALALIALAWYLMTLFSLYAWSSLGWLSAQVSGHLSAHDVSIQALIIDPILSHTLGHTH